MLIKDYEAHALRTPGMLDGALGVPWRDLSEDSVSGAVGAALWLTKAIGDLSTTLISMLGYVDCDTDLEDS